MLRKQALCIGINAYDSDDLVLKPCINDAQDVSRALQSLGFESYGAYNRNHNSMTSVIYRFIERIKPGSIVVFYFSGHGVQHAGRNYLIPSDAQNIWKGNIASRATDVQQIISLMHEKHPKVVICILDCCRYDAPSSSSGKSHTNRSIFDGMKSGLAPMQAPPSTIIAYACAADEGASAASKNNRNSLYTFHLLHYIRIPNVDIETLLKYVAIQVQKESEHSQIPFRYSSCNEFIYLGTNQPKVVPMSQPMIQKRFDPINQQKPPLKMFPVHYPQPARKSFYNNVHRHHNMLMNNYPVRKHHPSHNIGFPVHYFPAFPQNSRFHQ